MNKAKPKERLTTDSLDAFIAHNPVELEFYAYIHSRFWTQWHKMKEAQNAMIKIQ